MGMEKIIENEPCKDKCVVNVGNLDKYFCFQKDYFQCKYKSSDYMYLSIFKKDLYVCKYDWGAKNE